MLEHSQGRRLVRHDAGDVDGRLRGQDEVDQLCQDQPGRDPATLQQNVRRLQKIRFYAEVRSKRFFGFRLLSCNFYLRPALKNYFAKLSQVPRFKSGMAVLEAEVLC